MSIKNWPEQERPREKLLNLGPAALSSAELLAIFLRTGYRNKSALSLARDLLQNFGTLRQLLNADKTELCHYQGIGPVKYVQLQACLELGKRYLAENLQERPVLHNPSETRQFIRAQIRDYNVEVFCCLFLNNQHQIIQFEELFSGTVDCASVYPREVLRKALQYHASALIIAHNHPSGNPHPSQADIAITQQLRQALALVDIRLLDHFIIADNNVVSLAERGEL